MPFLASFLVYFNSNFHWSFYATFHLWIPIFFKKLNNGKKMAGNFKNNLGKKSQLASLAQLNFLSDQVNLFKLISQKVAFCALSVSEEINHFILAVCGDDNPFDGSFRKDLTSTPFLCLLLFVVFEKDKKASQLL